MAAAVGVLLCVGAAALYLKLSDRSWLSALATSRSPEVAALMRTAVRQPDDLEAWLRLGQASLKNKEMTVAADAYQHADRLALGLSAEALLGLALVSSARHPGEPDEQADRWVEGAVALEPDSPKALFLAAQAALHRGDLPLTRLRLAALLRMNPPPRVKVSLQQQIASIEQQLTPEAGESAGRPRAALRVVVTLSSNLHVDTASEAALFLFVRDPKQPGPPLAVKRLDTRFPQTVELTTADAMMSGRTFARDQEVEVVARLARSGEPIAASGDPFGTAAYHVRDKGDVQVVIDRLTP